MGVILGFELSKVGGAFGILKIEDDSDGLSLGSYRLQHGVLVAKNVSQFLHLEFLEIGFSVDSSHFVFLLDCW